MADTRTPEKRRQIMRAVKSKNTKPEMIVRQLLHAHGYRYRLHYRTLPGKPDLAFPGRKKAIFVHGCFWHGHGCKIGKAPKSRLDYWLPKLEANIARDRKKTDAIHALGWETLTVWQCELGDRGALLARLAKFLEKPIDTNTLCR